MTDAKSADAIKMHECDLAMSVIGEKPKENLLPRRNALRNG